MKIKDVIIQESVDAISEGDSFDIELGDLVIETGVVGFTEDGVIVEADEKTLALLGLSGALLESVDINEVSLGDYYKKATMNKALSQMSAAFAPSPEERAKNYNIAGRRERGLARAKVRGDKKAAELAAAAKADQEQRIRDKYAGVDIDAEIARLKPAIERAYNDYQYGARNTYGAARDEYNRLTAKVQELERAKKILQQGVVEGKESLSQWEERMKKLGYKITKDNKSGTYHAWEGTEHKDSYRTQGVAEAEMDEAKYQGREVPLGKPMAGDVKKSKVYVRGPKGNVVKVNFGDKKMKIKKSNPKRRKSFRARHNCANPGPRWKARYWSCRAW